MKLQDRVAVITGGGTGIGQDAALTLAREGARIIVSGRRPEPLEETVQLIREAGGVAQAVPCDVTKAEDIENLKNKTAELFGRCDILINNAGSGMNKPFMQTTLEDFDYIINIDLRSVFAVTQAFVPMLSEHKNGSIVNVSSILGVFGGLNSSAYCAAKGGVNNLTKALAAELGPMGIRVNGICPSHIETPMFKPMLDWIESKGKTEKLIKMFPVRRIGYPVDTSGAILFYASDDSSFITGTNLLIDGGLSSFV